MRVKKTANFIRKVEEHVLQEKKQLLMDFELSFLDFSECESTEGLFLFLVTELGFPRFSNLTAGSEMLLMFLLKLIVIGSGAADHLFDPTCESGDASVNAVEVRTATPFAPADHPSKEPAARWLLANQGPTRVSLTGKGNVLHLSWGVVQFVFAVPDRHLFLHCGNQRKAFWE